MGFLIKILILLSFVGISRASICPLVFAQKYFDVTKYAGLWYEAYRHDINEEDITCINGTYTAQANGTMGVLSQGLKKLTGYYSHQGVATPKASSDPAAFLIHYKNPTQTVKYDVTATDYENYSVVYSCDYFPIIGLRFEHIWFLSRNKTLPDSTVEALKKILRDKLIETSGINPTPQNC
ncbi:unnamed protein product [Rotaria socialis]